MYQGRCRPPTTRPTIVIATSGGSDWLWPTTTATPNGDGYQVSGRKVFCSQAPAATVVAIHFAPVVGATYYGIAAGARDVAVDVALHGSRGAGGDVRAGTFHPFAPELTLEYAGKARLGDPAVTE